MSTAVPPPAPSQVNQLELNILNSVTEAIIATDHTYSVIFINPAAQNLTGLSARMALHQPLSQLFAAEDKLLYLARVAMEEARSISDHETIVLHRAYSAPLPISASASPLYNDAGNQSGIILTMHNAANLHQLQQDLQRVDRLAMLGTLAAGLAHEIKNPLGGIRGAAQLLSLEMEERPDLAEYTQVIVRETDRINGIINELMDLTRERPRTFDKVNISRIIRDIVLLQQQVPQFRRIAFHLHLDPSIPPISADEVLITRLLLNIIKNAAEAITDAGSVTITTRINTEHHLSIPGRQPVPFVVISVNDSGSGIDADTMKKIFTPFFTTKSGGSGLGMAICQKIVNQHDGLLNIESTPGAGTSCYIYLPLKR